MADASACSRANQHHGSGTLSSPAPGTHTTRGAGSRSLPPCSAYPPLETSASRRSTVGRGSIPQAAPGFPAARIPAPLRPRSPTWGTRPLDHARVHTGFLSLEPCVGVRPDDVLRTCCKRSVHSGPALQPHRYPRQPLCPGDRAQRDALKSQKPRRQGANFVLSSHSAPRSYRNNPAASASGEVSSAFAPTRRPRTEPRAHGSCQTRGGRGELTLPVCPREAAEW